MAEARIAVIGSGIAGLSISWLLSNDEKNQVVLFEKARTLGMDSNSVNIPAHLVNQNYLNNQPDNNNANKQNNKDNSNVNKDNLVRVDMPLRVFTDSYYPNLRSLYDQVGVKYSSQDYSGSFSSLNGINWFSYQNFLFSSFSVPYWPVNISLLFKSNFWKILYELVYFLLMSRRHLHSGRLGNVALLKDLLDQQAHLLSVNEINEKFDSLITFGSYLKSEGYSDIFMQRMLIPCLAAICTCSHHAVLEYPALLIIHYLSTRSMRGVRRVDGGTEQVVNKLSEKCTVKLNETIVNIEPDINNTGVTVSTESGNNYHFDQVIIACQANQALAMLQSPNISPEVKEALSCIPYEKSELIVHTDENLMPKNRKMWKPVNFILPEVPTYNENIDREGMATIWMNEAQSNLSKKLNSNIFQTWNPIIQPNQEHIISRSTFERPVVTLRSLSAISRLWRYQGMGRIWFCGSYVHIGMPLLETAVTSAVQVSKRLGTIPPWDQVHVNQNGTNDNNNNSSHRLRNKKLFLLLGSALAITVGSFFYFYSSSPETPGNRKPNASEIWAKVSQSKPLSFLSKISA